MRPAARPSSSPAQSWPAPYSALSQADGSPAPRAYLLQFLPPCQKPRPARHSQSCAQRPAAQAVPPSCPVLPAKLAYNECARSLDVLGLIFVEASRVHQLLKLVNVRIRVLFRSAVFFEKCRRNLVHALI